MGECEAMERSVRQKMKKKKRKERWGEELSPVKEIRR